MGAGISHNAGQPAKDKAMAKLSLNFCEPTGRHEPTRNEINQIESVALSIEAMVKALYAYASEDAGEKPHGLHSVCMGVCNALELLIDPVIEYMANYAGQEPAPEATKEGAK